MPAIHPTAVLGAGLGAIAALERSCTRPGEAKGFLRRRRRRGEGPVPCTKMAAEEATAPPPPPPFAKMAAGRGAGFAPYKDGGR